MAKEAGHSEKLEKLLEKFDAAWDKKNLALQISIIKQIGKITTPEAAGELDIIATASDSALSARVAAVRALGNMGTETALEFLEGYSDFKNPRLKSAVKTSVSKTRRALSPPQERKRHPTPQLNAAYLLEDLHNADTVQDELAVVRRLGTVKSPESARILGEEIFGFMGEGKSVGYVYSVSVRREAIKSLRKIGSIHALETLVELRREGGQYGLNKEIDAAILKLMPTARPGEGISVLKSIASDFSEDYELDCPLVLRLEAIKALGRCRTSEAAEALKEIRKVYAEDQELLNGAARIMDAVDQQLKKMPDVSKLGAVPQKAGPREKPKRRATV